MQNEDHPLPEAMRSWVLEELARIEKEYQVKVLYACESGSRAWGFASPDSDFDVRFVYLPQLSWYLSVERQRDVIERPLTDELDVSGWELRKTLQLLKKSNPTLLEWLDSPLVYQSDPQATNGLRELAQHYYSPAAARAHYLAMAHNNYRGYLQGSEVRYKKYLYVLRPLLAVAWIDQGLGMPPTAFTNLLQGILPSGEVRADIDDLLRLKRLAGEAEYGPARPVLQRFIESALAQAEGHIAPRGGSQDSRLLNQFLQDTLTQHHGLSI